MQAHQDRTLRFRPPYDWAALLGFLAKRAIPGVERVQDGCYRRTVLLDGRPGWLEVRAAGPDTLRVRFDAACPDVPDAIPDAIAARLRRQFDLDADPREINARLGRDPVVGPLVAARPGLRVPGAWDPFEMAVRAILGQQVTVTAATTLAGRVAAAYGIPLQHGDGDLAYLFPTPEILAAADLNGLGVPGARARAVTGLAAALAARPDLLSPEAPVEETVAALVRLPGIGPWTAQYIAMRVLRAPDAFPESDLGLIRALERRGLPPTPKAVRAAAEGWRPFRAYALMHLWTAAGSGG